MRNNTPILLRDVAEVKVAPAIRFGDSLIMGKPGVLLSLASQYGANTLNTTLDVEKALADLRPALDKQGIQMYTGLHRPATFIERALQNLKQSLLIAAVARERIVADSAAATRCDHRSLPGSPRPRDLRDHRGH